MVLYIPVGLALKNSTFCRQSLYMCFVRISEQTAIISLHNINCLSQYLTNFMHKICFTISFISCLCMFRANVLIIMRSKLHYTASGIITPVGGRLVHETATYRPQNNSRSWVYHLGILRYTTYCNFYTCRP